MKTYTAVPKECIIGDTLTITIDGGEYPAPTWSLALVLISQESKSTTTATATGADHTFTIDTSPLTPGRYDYQLQATSEGYRSTIGRGIMEAAADLADEDLTTFDGRSHAEKVLDAIEAVLENRASKSQKAQTIGMVQLEHFSFVELVEFRDLYKRKVQAERAASGAGSLFTTIHPRFTS